MSAALPPYVLAGIKETLGAAVIGGILATTYVQAFDSVFVSLTICGLQNLWYYGLADVHLLQEVSERQYWAKGTGECNIPVCRPERELTLFRYRLVFYCRCLSIGCPRSSFHLLSSILDTATTVCVADGLYGYMVVDFGRPDLLSVTPISLAVEEGVTVRVFFHRLYYF